MTFYESVIKTAFPFFFFMIGRDNEQGKRIQRMILHSTGCRLYSKTPIVPKWFIFVTSCIFSFVFFSFFLFTYLFLDYFLSHFSMHLILIVSLCALKNSFLDRWRIMNVVSLLSFIDGSIHVILFHNFIVQSRWLFRLINTIQKICKLYLPRVNHTTTIIPFQ